MEQESASSLSIKRPKLGFTLIEIVIALAVASIIMVMVFLAVQGAQRAQRDNFRKDVANRAAAATHAYRGNNNGANPVTPDQLVNYVPNLSSQGVTIVFDAANTPGTCPAGESGSQPLWIVDTAGVVSSNVCLESSADPYSRTPQ